MDLLIKNVTIYTVDENNTIYENASIGITEGKIEKIYKKGESIPDFAKNEIDGTGKVVFPGFVNTHIHIFQSLLKGLGSDHRLIEWLNLSALPYGAQITSSLQYDAARLASMEALQSGCTTLSEFFYTTQSEEFAHAVIEGMQEIGIRSVFIRTFQDTGLEYGMPECFIEDASIAMNKVEALRKHYGNDSDLLQIWTGPDVTWSTTKEGYQTMLEYCRAQDVRYSMHIQETEVDNQMTQKYYGKNIVDMLEELNFLSDKFLAVHCVNLTDHEIALFAQHGVNVSHNPMANMYLGSGFAPIVKMKNNHVRVTVGTDGAASNNTTNMLETLKMATVTQKALYRDAAIITAQDILRAATIEGARAIGLGDVIGSVEEGKQADLFLFKPNELTSFPVHDPLASLVYSSTLNNIETTIVKGRVLYNKGMFTNMPDIQGFYGKVTNNLNALKSKINL